MKIMVLWLAKHMGLFALSRRLTRRGVRILCYHGIWLGPRHYGNFLFMSPEKFRQRIRFLRNSPYPVISLDEAVSGLAAGTLPDCATVITIDDGWYGTYRHMVPELATAKLPATIYSTTYYTESQTPIFGLAVAYMFSVAPKAMVDLSSLGPVFSDSVDLASPDARELAIQTVMEYGEEELDRTGRHELCGRLGTLIGVDYAELDRNRVFHLMTFDELKDTAARGIGIQLHTHRHRFRTNDPADNEREIEDNRSRLQAISTQPLKHFCYPSGEYEPSAWPQLTKFGIVSATTTDQGLAYADSEALALDRLSDGERVHMLAFEAELAGFNELLRRFRR